MTLTDLLILSWCAITFSAKATQTTTPCPPVLSIDITGGERLEDGSVKYESYLFTPDTYFLDNGVLRGCVCQIVRTCIRKCCPLGTAMYGKKCKNHPEGFPLTVYNRENAVDVDVQKHFYFIPSKTCRPRGMYKLNPDKYSDDVFYVQFDGSLYVPFAENTLLYPEDYCVDVFVSKNKSAITALVCNTDEEGEKQEARQELYSVGMIISMPFLLLTFIVYALLPDRNLHGKALMCYVISLFGAYFLLVFIQLYPHTLDETTCKTLGLLCLFCFMVSFFWMNVMSVDIWWAFSGLRGFSGSKREVENKRFLLYTGYAFGMPLLHVILVVCLTVSITPPNDKWYNPGIGDGQCWFRNGVPTLVYFYGPMAVLIVANIIFFIVTAWKIKQVQQDTAMLRKDESKKHSYENDKQRFNLYLKLMLAMGVNWSMEIISWAINWQLKRIPPAVWYITDFCNALYGVLIFFIFVFKRNIWKLLKRRYYLLMGKPHLARSMTQTASPRTTTTSFNNAGTGEGKSYPNDSSILTSEVA